MLHKEKGRKKQICNLNITIQKERDAAYKVDNEFEYVAGMVPRSIMSFITSACMWVNFNSKVDKV